ncbi:hypothetical protein VitviT2T_010195 [Vitis vinifera]|uniref:Uncharacterized protein n=1 Tax=Vitis vinifera TaxID=29760 RepID=A0ABY9C7U0_VITVI|nr:hypothetical protein VitviT2T_010195 [Vitis vinifera]
MVELDNPNFPQWAAEVLPEVLKMASETALETALLSQWALYLLPWLSFAGDGHLTWSNNASLEDSTARVQAEAGRLLVAEALVRSLEQAPLTRLSCGRTEMMTLLL